MTNDPTDQEPERDRREIQHELYEKLSDLARYYMAEHDLSTIEVLGALHLVSGGLSWVHNEVCGAVPEIYQDERRKAGNSCRCGDE